MKILFVITSKGHGRGGHFYSLRETVLNIKPYLDTFILNVGLSPSPIVQDVGHESVFIKYQGMGATVKKIFKLVKNYNPDLVHAFDFESFCFMRLALFTKKIPIVLTKCGGPNPVKYYPLTETLITYSEENKKYFENNKKYSDSRLFLIPNRVSRPKQDRKRIKALKDYLRPDIPVVLRITRIGHFYRRSILQSIELVNRLNHDGFPCQLLIIGAVQDHDVLEEIVESKHHAIYVETNDRFTVNANELLDIADCVIASGRGFAEAALVGKLVLVPNSNINIPSLVHEHNVEKFSVINFSERIVEDSPEENVYGDIKSVFIDLPARKMIANSIQRFASEHYGSDRIYVRHLDVYKQARQQKFSLKLAYDTALHIYLTWKSMRSALRKLAL